MKYFKLDENGQPVQCEGISEWAHWIEGDPNLRVALDTIGDVEVSTVFLSISTFDNEPQWETMIFGGKHDLYQRRYKTREDAVRGHEETLELVKS